MSQDIRIRVTDKARTVAAGVHAHVPPPSLCINVAQPDDDFYSNPDFLNAVEEIERAVHERNALSNGTSFTLGGGHGAGPSHVPHTTHIAPCVERAAVIGTPSATKDSSANPSAQPSSSAPHGAHTTLFVMIVLQPPPSLGLTQGAGNSPVRQRTPFGTSEQRPSISNATTRVITTRSAAKHNVVIPSAQTSPATTPTLSHLSVPDEGVTTTPQVVVPVPRPPTSTTSFHTGRAPLKQLKPLREGKHPPTPVVTKLSHHVGQVGGRPTWTVPNQSYVYRWVVDNVKDHRDEELFRYKDYKATWGGIATLQEGSKVAYRVVDAWACVLNYRELTKGAGVPNRFFASSKIALQSAINHTPRRSLRLEWFTKNLEADFNNSPHETWRGIHMYIFPILQLGHFYMISVDTVAKKVDIIDSSSAAKKKGEMYGQTPTQLVDLLSTFLDDKLLTELGAQTRDVKPKRMQMSWRVAKNEVDSAVYTMRHMESYCGQGVTNWNVGLQRGNYRQLRVLREYIMREILIMRVAGKLAAPLAGGIRNHESVYSFATVGNSYAYTRAMPHSLRPTNSGFEANCFRYA
nr:uncharacterized protein LOC109157732 isoform X2 [Ipomoea batatas]